jgi:hypothetical protein
MQLDYKYNLKPFLIYALILFFLLLPAALNLIFIAQYGVNCVFWDQWEVVSLFDRLNSGNLSFTDLFSQHNEQRPFLPRVVMLSLGTMTNYNTIAEMYFSWVLLCGICTALFLLFIRHRGRSRLSLIQFIPVVWLVFSLRQIENLLWGFQIAIFMIILLVLLTIYLLAESKGLDWRFALSIMCGLAATFTAAQGLLIWHVGLIQIFIGRWPLKGKRWGPVIRTAAVWLIVSVAAYLVYFKDFGYPQHHPNPFYFMQHPLISISYGAIAFGSPLSFDIYTAAAIGVLLFILSVTLLIVAVIKPKMISSDTSFFSVLFYSISVVASLVLVRSGFGIDQALASRYTTMIIPGIAALYILVISLDFNKLNVKSFSSGLLICLIVVGILATDSHAYFKAGKDMYTERRTAAYYLANYTLQPDENLLLLYPIAQTVRQRTDTLIKYKLNVYSEPVSPLPSANIMPEYPLFVVDTINAKPLSPQTIILIDSEKEKTLKLGGWAVDQKDGWAVDQKDGKAAGGVFFNIDGKSDIPALYGLDRPDVANYFKNSKYRYSGFFASVDISIIGRGQHTLSIKVISNDKQSCYEAVRIIGIDVR